MNRKRKKRISIGKVIFLTLLLFGVVILVTYILHGPPVEIAKNEKPVEEKQPEGNIPEKPKGPDEKKPFHEAKTVEVQAKGGFVYDIDHQELLFYKPSSISTYSIMKILTTLYAMEHIGPDETITIGREIHLLGDNASIVSLPEGQNITVRDLLKAIYLPSGSDAAYTLSVAVARKLHGNHLTEEEALETFVKDLNNYVKTIPMVPIAYDLSGEKQNPIERDNLHQTQVITPDGYPQEGQYSSVCDVLAIAYQVLQRPILQETMKIAKDEITFDNGTYLHLSSSNPFLHKDSPYYNPNVIGMKTGSFVDGDRYNMITWHKDGKNNLLIGVFEEEVEELRYQETQKLLETFKLH